MASSFSFHSSITSLPLASLKTIGISSYNPCFRAFPAKSLRISCQAASPETVEKVIQIVTKQLACEDAVHPHSKFQDLGADSLDQVEIVMALEEAFGINVDESGAEAIVTIQDAADLCEKSKSEKGKA